MCQAFSCLITKSKKVYWEAGIDSHSELQEKFVKKDKELKDKSLFCTCISFLGKGSLAEAKK